MKLESDKFKNPGSMIRLIIAVEVFLLLVSCLYTIEKLILLGLLYFAGSFYVYSKQWLKEEKNEALFFERLFKGASGVILVLTILNRFATGSIIDHYFNANSLLYCRR